MKLEMTLPERPGFIHAVPVVNIFALMQLFFLLGPSLVLQSGVSVDLPPSKFQMERYQESLVVSLSPGDPAPRIHFGREAVTQQELAARLDKLHDDGASTKAIVLLQTDAALPVGAERDISEMVLSKGFRLAIVGKTLATTAIPKLPTDK